MPTKGPLVQFVIRHRFNMAGDQQFIWGFKVNEPMDRFYPVRYIASKQSQLAVGHSPYFMVHEHRQTKFCRVGQVQ